MRIVIFGGVLVYVVVALVVVWRRADRRATEQFVKLTERRHAELLDVQRRQQEDG